MRGLMVAGDVADDGFRRWDLGTRDALARIADEWFRRADPGIHVGEVVRLDNTPAGDEIDRAALER